MKPAPRTMILRIAATLAPHRERRAHYEKHPEEVRDILRDGEARARGVAEQTMKEVHEAMHVG